MKISKLFASAAVVAAVLTTSSAFGAAWLTPSGSTATFNYSGGTDDNGLFGNPIVSDKGLSFVPNNFIAVSKNGVGDVKTDRLQVQIDAKGTGAITGVDLSELGDYSINDGGDVKEFAFLVVRVLDANYTGQRLFSVGSTPGFNTTTTGDASSGWTDGLSLTLPTPAKSILIVLNNNLHAGSLPGGTAIIQKKFVDGGTTPGINIRLPEPATLTAVMGGLSVLGFRRRKA